MSLTTLLPKPVYAQAIESDSEASDEEVAPPVMKGKITAPPYGKRAGWVPRNPSDFGDGGAYPECHIAQFPQGLGKKNPLESKAVLPLSVDANGKVRHDALLHQGRNKDKIIYSSYNALVAADVSQDDDKRRLPSEEEIKKQLEETKAALGIVIDGKVAAAQQTSIPKQNTEAVFIRYTPSQNLPGYNSGASQRVIRMVEVKQDPLEPPKFKNNKKIPRGPPSPPPPVLHSPPRKVTAEEQAQWKIPPCISNWKNAKGYTIPLDKRLANDGTGLQDVTINDNFAKLSESLFIAERKSREAIATRESIQKKAAQLEKERHEQSLRNLAQQARDESSNFRINTAEVNDVAEREKIREERHRERERQRRIAAAAPDKRNKLMRDEDRDVSERIALGLPVQKVTEGQVDSRLYGQSQGMTSGFNPDDDAYDVYDKPLKSDKPTAIYRPSNKKDEYAEDDLEKIRTADRFRPDKGFQGTEGKMDRSGPVQFEKDNADFGIDDFLTDVKKKRTADTTADDTSKRRR